MDEEHTSAGTRAPALPATSAFGFRGLLGRDGVDMPGEFVS
jgi:hypothetical protein